MPFKDTPEGQTNYCIVCEKEARGLKAVNVPHTCGIDKSIVNHLQGGVKMANDTTTTADMDINDIRRVLMKQKFLDLREKLAELEHMRWSEWQSYVHNTLLDVRLTGKVLPDTYFYRWERQINTPYDDLTEKEKDSDREQVYRYWPLIEEILKILN